MKENCLERMERIDSKRKIADFMIKEKQDYEFKKKYQRQAQKNLNDKNSKKMCERVIGENFTDRDIWATFTYTDDNMPASMEVATKNMQNYIRRLNYQRKKQGLSNARYVYVTECSEKGRWHHHIVMDGDVDMDTVEAVWNLGKRNEIRRLQRDENGLVGMARYITKEKSKKGKYQKTWCASKGLRKPKEKVNHYKTKRLTKRQKEFLYGYFMDMGDRFKAEQFIKE